MIHFEEISDEKRDEIMAAIKSIAENSWQNCEYMLRWLSRYLASGGHGITPLPLSRVPTFRHGFLDNQ